jgi:hypothetical protein
MSTQSEILSRSVANLKAAGGKIVIKEGWFWKTLHYIVMIVTFGGNRNFLEGYYTTIGPWVGVPKDWESRGHLGRAAVLEHESIHIKQCKKFGLGNVYLGLPLYTILYLLLPLPFGFAYFRWRFEREAYTHGINFRIRHRPDERTRLIENAVIELSSGRYGWTHPFPKRARAYFEEHVNT